jgi:hypothetical protein
MNKLPYLIAEINAALEVYISGRTGQQYNRTAFILCDDSAELASKLFLLSDNKNWSDKGAGKPFKSFRDVTGEVRAIFAAKRAADYPVIDTLLKQIEGRRDRRNKFFHSTDLLDLTLQPRDCVDAFCDLLDYGKLLFPADAAKPGSGWDAAIAAAGNMETCEALMRLDRKSYGDPGVPGRLNDVLSKWPRNSILPTPKKKGCEVTHHAEDMHLRLAIRNGGKELRDRLRAGVVEIAEGVIAAQVVAFRGQWAAAVSSRIVRDNAVLDGRRAIVRDAAAAIASSSSSAPREWIMGRSTGAIARVNCSARFSMDSPLSSRLVSSFSTPHQMGPTVLAVAPHLPDTRYLQ